MVAGLRGISSVLSLRSSTMMSCHIGAAPVIPDVRYGFIGELSLLPTQTTAVNDGVYPAVQLSRFSLVVPVLTDTVFPGMTSAELGPNADCRALLSESMLEMIHATSG